MVLEFEAIRKWVFASGGVCLPSSVVPTVALKLPLRRADLDERTGDEHVAWWPSPQRPEGLPDRCA